jgi:hypothetical protein
MVEYAKDTGYTRTLMGRYYLFYKMKQWEKERGALGNKKQI